MSEAPRRVGSRALSMGAGVALSRLTGLLREQSFAYLFGASAATQAFVAAFRLPNFFRDLLAENVATAAVLPAYVGVREKEGREAAGRFAASVLALVLVASALIASLGILFAEPLCRLVTPGFVGDAERFGLVVTLTRWLFPFLAFIAVAAFFQAIQNAENRFFVPAVSTAVLNLVFIASGWLLVSMADPPILGMAWGALLGGAAAVAVLAPGYVRAAGRLSLSSFRGKPEIREMLKLAAPVVVGVAATDVNVLVNTLMASLAEDGAIAYLNFSYRIMHLPLGLIAVSLGTAALPALARAHAKADEGEYRATLADALGYALRYALPAATGMVLLRTDVVAALYGYGRFSAADVNATALALAAYSAGIPAFALNRILSPAFYARKESRTPVTFGVVSVGVNILLNVAALLAGAGFFGIALAASAAGYVQTALLATTLRRRAGGIGGRRLPGILVSSLGGLAALAAAVAIPATLGIGAVIPRLGLSILLGGVSYLAVESLLRRLIARNA